MDFLRNGGGFCLSKFYVFLYITMAYGIVITYGLPIEEEALQEEFYKYFHLIEFNKMMLEKILKVRSSFGTIRFFVIS